MKFSACTLYMSRGALMRSLPATQGVRIVLSMKSSSAAAAGRSEEAGSPASVLDTQMALEGGIPSAAPAPPGSKRKRNVTEDGPLCALRARLEDECSQVGLSPP